MAGDLTRGSHPKANTGTGLSDADADADWDWLMRRLDDPRLQPASRACLGLLCQGRRVFHSSHAGNRICDRCKEASNGLFGGFEESQCGAPS